MLLSNYKQLFDKEIMMGGDFSQIEVKPMGQPIAPVAQPQPIRPVKTSKTPVIIMVIVIVCLLGIIGAGAYFYLNQAKCASTTTTNESAATTGLLSNDTYKIYTYKQEAATINGDSCDLLSVLSLYKDQNIATLSDSSCLGGEVKIGTYDVYTDKVAIEFKTRVGLGIVDGQSRLNLREDISGNVVSMIVNNDGTATSTLFIGNRIYTKR